MTTPATAGKATRLTDRWARPTTRARAKDRLTVLAASGRAVRWARDRTAATRGRDPTAATRGRDRTRAPSPVRRSPIARFPRARARSAGRPRRSAAAVGRASTRRPIRATARAAVWRALPGSAASSSSICRARAATARAPPPRIARTSPLRSAGRETATVRMASARATSPIMAIRDAPPVRRAPTCRRPTFATIEERSYGSALGIQEISSIHRSNVALAGTPNSKLKTLSMGNAAPLVLRSRSKLKS